MNSGQVYYYEVCAINIAGSSERSNEVSATPQSIDILSEYLIVVVIVALAVVAGVFVVAYRLRKTKLRRIYTPETSP